MPEQALEQHGQTADEETQERYSEATFVEEIARELIPEHHTHLVEAEILFTFRNGGWTSRGEPVKGRTYRVDGRQKFHTGADFEIVVNSDVWFDLDPAQQQALTDHLLCYAGCEDLEDGSRRWVIWNPDLVEFKAVVKRHGLWQQPLHDFDEAMRQVSLFNQDNGRVTANA